MRCGRVLTNTNYGQSAQSCQHTYASRGDLHRCWGLLCDSPARRASTVSLLEGRGDGRVFKQLRAPTLAHDELLEPLEQGRWQELRLWK
jgi:hypothetical protein